MREKGEKTRGGTKRGRKGGKGKKGKWKKETKLLSFKCVLHIKIQHFKYSSTFVLTCWLELPTLQNPSYFVEELPLYYSEKSSHLAHFDINFCLKKL